MDIPGDLEITITDMREAGHCARMRGWFMQHDLYDDFRLMVKGGSIPASKMIATGDPRAIKIVERKARKVTSNG